MIIVTLIPLLIFFAILYLRFNKGKIAEKMVHHKLMQLPEEYHVIDNVLFMSNGRSTQIDHIVVSPYAVFVIETQGYKGWIFGGESTEYWTQSIYGHKYNARSKQYDIRNKIQHGVCPRCGGMFVERRGKYGCFYGSSNYPKCTFTLNK